MIVLRLSTGLSPDVLAELQDDSRTEFMAAIRLVAFLQQLCDKAQGHCMMIARHLLAKYVSASSYVSRMNVLQQTCILIRL